jgi:hypothetical protein
LQIRAIVIVRIIRISHHVSAVCKHSCLADTGHSVDE